MLLEPYFSTWSTCLRLAVVGLLLLAVSYDLAGLSDIALLFVVAVFSNWEWTLQILQAYELRPIFGVARGIALAFGLTQIPKWLRKRKKSRAGKGSPANESPRPLFFPSRTTQTRLFPKSHSFSYSYLLVGIPVGWRGSVGGMLAADQGASRPALDTEDGCTASG